MADKGIFVLLFMSQGLKDVKVSMDMLGTRIPGPCADQSAITVSSVIQVSIKAKIRMSALNNTLQLLTTVASACPDSTIRFVTYKLIEKFLSVSNEEVQLFLFGELLQRCPYPSMKVAAIGLLKDHVCKVLEQNKVTQIYHATLDRRT